MKILVIFGCVLLGLPTVAACNDEEPQIDEAPIDLHRLLTYPFTGPVAWGVHDVDIEERIIKRFGPPIKRIPSILEEKNGESVYDRDFMLDYDNVTFYLRGRHGQPVKIIQGITVKSESVPIVFGIKLGQHISTLPFENPPDGVYVDSRRGKIFVATTIDGTIVLDGQEMPATADCTLTISFDDGEMVSAIKWYYGTGH